jgi:hypothetical protein
LSRLPETPFSHPYDAAVQSDPPETPDELTAHVAGYLDALERIFAVHGTGSLQGMQLALEATTLFVARLYPAGNSGPGCLFAPLMGALIDAQRGIVPPLFVDAAEKTTHPPKAARLTILQAYAAATMSLLMELGESQDRAAAIVAKTLEKGGVPFTRERFHIQC